MASKTQENKGNVENVEDVNQNSEQSDSTNSQIGKDAEAEKDQTHTSEKQISGTEEEGKLVQAKGGAGHAEGGATNTEGGAPTAEGGAPTAEGGASGEPQKSSAEERLVIGQELDKGKEAASKKDLESVDVSREVPLDDDSRMKMFEEGLGLDKEGKKTEALKCYLKCLVGLKENSRFSLLPQCLRNIADIYYNKDEYDKAISFIQAEKLYYESVLIDDSQLQKHIDEVMKSSGDQASSDPDMNIDAIRATEYEQLARLCMDEKQPQLALEYAGKATKLRQQVYGDGHPLVQESLDYFATVYAEVGKVQYSESMSKYAAAGEPDMSGGADLSGTDISGGSPEPTEPTSILRKRKGESGEREKKVRFDESQVPSTEVLEREEWCARTVLLLLFLSLCCILVLLGLYIYCNIQRSSNCVQYKQMLHDAFMRVRYWFYHYSSTKDLKYT